MNYNFDKQHAILYGVDEAIMIHNFIFWIDKNKANKKHFYENRFWTYNSVEAFKSLFEFWTPKQLRRIIESLVSQKIIMRGNFNKSNIDRTGWYAFVDQDAFLGITDLPKRANAFAQTDKPIPDSNTDNKTSLSNDKDNIVDLIDLGIQATTEKKEKEKSSAKKENKISEENFVMFWDMYGHKVGLKESKVSWNKIKIDTQFKILELLPNWKSNHDPKIALPYPATFLNNERWNDEIIKSSEKSLYPDYYDRKFEATLSMQDANKYTQHLRSVGFEPVKSWEGNIVNWRKKA